MCSSDLYDGVVEATPAERQLMAKAPFDEAEYKKDLGINQLVGEKDRIERGGLGLPGQIEVITNVRKRAR